MNLNKNYSKNYYERRSNLSFTSAKKTLRYLKKVYDFSSVVDFGCGTGTWLKVCQEIGCTEILGLDDYTEESLLEIPKENFMRKNIGEPVQLQKKYDLAISLEAAEHLGVDCSENIVINLVHASDVILFSAALPGQGGTNHVNEQPPNFWATKFKKHNFVQYDFLRSLIWEEDEVAWWYKQNIFLYINENSQNKIGLPDLGNDLSFKHIVHPDCLNSRIQELDLDNASIKNLLKAVVKNALRKLP